MKTAVEWLYETLWKQNNYSLPSNILEQAKEMEKEQIKTAYLNGNAFGIDIDNGLSPSHYYNETFKQSEQ
jgi:hypothetical protein